MKGNVKGKRINTMSMKRECERVREEYLEILWRMKEEKQESLEYLKKAIGEGFNSQIIDDLEHDGLVSIHDELPRISEIASNINLTDKGETYARKIIRAHRIAEKLICDAVGGGDLESGACEFEHVINTDLVDSICVLLGHPRLCPHGKPIPEGECCKSATQTVHPSVKPLTDLVPGMSGRIAWVNYSDDIQLHKMDSLKIKPGQIITLLQRSPSYVVNCEGMDVALDFTAASTILLWKEGGQFNSGGEQLSVPGKCRRKRGFGFMRYRKEA